MSSAPALLAVATAAVLAGLLLAGVGVAGTTRPARRDSGLRRRARAWAGAGLSARQRHVRQTAAGLAAAATVVVWLATAIPMAGLIAGFAVLGVPWLFAAGRAELHAIATLEGLESWTRRLTDLVRSGLGLTQAILVSARDAPAAIAGELHELEAQLTAQVDTVTALDRFAARLGDATSDEVIVALRLHATDRGQRLEDILDKLSENIARNVAMRREVWASRADPRLTTRFMTGITIAVLGLLFANPTYMRPYASVTGQLVLAGCTAGFVALLVWIRRLSLPRPVPRLLAPGKDGPA